jgi:hypothetical protein
MKPTWVVKYEVGEHRTSRTITADSHKAAVRALLAEIPSASVYRVRCINSEFLLSRSSTPTEAPKGRLSSRNLRLKNRRNGKHRGTTKVAQAH